jgi:tetratricopeptide (TPR) repeat protein
MKHKINWKRSLSAFILVMLLVSACKIFSPPLVPFKPGDPTATPLGSDITDPNFIKGVEAFKERNYPEVLTRMSAVIESDPELAPAYRYRGAAYLSLGNCQAGLADEEKALSIIPNYGAAFGARGALYGCLGDHEQELQDYDKALSLDPSLAFVHLDLGIYYFNIGNYDKALEEYNLSIAIDPYRSDAWARKGELFGRLRKYDDCIESNNKALKLNPEEWYAYLYKGLCNLSMHNNGPAEASITTFLEHVPTNPCAWVKLGIVQARQSKYEEAINSYDRALELDPTSCEALINRGDAYINLDEYEKAWDDYNQALELGDSTAYSGRGTADYWLGKYDEAIADLESATQQIPDNPPAYTMLGLAYLKVGRYQEALAAAAAAANSQIQPGYETQTNHEIQSRAYYGLGDYEKALTYINNAIEMNASFPGYYTGYYYRAIIYQATGKSEEAISDLEKFLSVVPEKKKFQEEIADAKKRLADLKP